MTRRRFMLLGLLFFTPSSSQEGHSEEYWRWWRSRRGM